MRLTCVYACLCLMIISCENMQKDSQTLATAYGEHLKMDDVAHLLSDHHSPLDSQHIMDKAVDNWLMQEILLHEAENKVGVSSEIEQLVDDYKRSLYIRELEELQLKEHLDTSIMVAELDTFYEQSREDWVLDEPIVQFLFVKVPLKQYDETLKNLWKTEDLPALRSLAYKSEKNILLLDPDKWYYQSSLKNIVPSELWKKIDISKNENYRYTDGDDQLLLKILGSVDKGKTAPKLFAYPMIKQRILHDRSSNYLKQWRKDQYQNNIRSKEISIYENNN